MTGTATVACSSCDRALSDEARFCSACGQPRPACAGCGALLSPPFRFCRRCGEAAPRPGDYEPVASAFAEHFGGGTRAAAPGPAATTTGEPSPARRPRAAGRYGVVYLRSFGDDGETVVLRTNFIGKLALAGEEADTAAVLADFGPVIAPGRPGERLPAEGVTPWTVPDGAWPDAVFELVREARLLVVRVGAPGELLDVLAEAGRCLRPEQILLLVPLDRAGYEAVRPGIEAALQRPLPEYRAGQSRADSLRGFVRFGSHGSASFVTFERRYFYTRSRRPVISRLRTAMEPVYREHGVRWTPEPLNLWRVLGVACGALLLLGVLALAAGLLLFGP